MMCGEFRVKFLELSEEYETPKHVAAILDFICTYERCVCMCHEGTIQSLVGV